MNGSESFYKTVPAVRLIVMENPGAAAALCRILKESGYRTACSPDFGEPPAYLVLPPSRLREVRGETVPFVLSVEREWPGFRTEKFARCVIDSAFSGDRRSIPAEKLVTYSAESDSADFTARNIRKTDEGVVFEIVGVGVIGRVRLADEKQIEPCLIAACAAVSCGIPFADVLGSLNRLFSAKEKVYSETAFGVS
ncbi:conserved protein of unknown function [Ruminococcaceae bacterium BL-6]|jgi:hypothetical protein|nr:conserved protein of unknown function [Ruminococcaceae bacterium BL-6]HBC26846.1 hypothetical protein [Oscillospiraceae bacterium]